MVIGTFNDIRKKIEKTSCIKIQKMSLQNKEYKQNHHEISFQLHIDALREQKIPWNTFVKMLEEIFHSDMDKLKYLNALILTELTISYSDIERSKYLNTVLLKELQNLIEKEYVSEMTENVDSNDYDLNVQTNKEESSIDSEIIMSGLKENVLASSNDGMSNCNQEYVSELTENMNSNDSFSIGHDLNIQTIKEKSMNNSESSNNSEIHITIMKEIALASSNEDEPNYKQCNPSTKTFPCSICEKVFTLSFHLKSNI